MQIEDQQFRLLIKITLRTQTSTPIKLTLPYLKNFQPVVSLTTNQHIYIPVLESIVFSAHREGQIETAVVKVQPKLLERLDEKIYVNIQTYSERNREMQGGRYCLEFEFANVVVYDKQPNLLDISLKKMVLKKNPKKTNIYVKVIVDSGFAWSSKGIPGVEHFFIDELVSVNFKTLLDSVTIQILAEKEKVSDVSLFVFQLLRDQYQILQTKGFLAGSIKLGATTQMPLMIVE